MKKRLVLLLDNYPYLPGEYSFIKHELKYLPEKFDVTILSVSNSDEQKMIVDPDIELHHLKMKCGMKDIIPTCIRMIFSRFGRKEISDIIRAKKNIPSRLYYSALYLGYARLVSRYARQNILKEKDENLLVYSYWFNHSCLGFLLNKKEYPGMKVVSRVHGYDLYEFRNPYGRQPFRSFMDELTDKIFFVGQSGKDYYTEAYNRNPDSSKYIISPIGTDKPLKLKTDKAPGVFEIVSCAACLPVKRIHLIIDALSLIRKEDIEDRKIRWTHFGNGPLFDELSAKAKGMLDQSEAVEYEFKGYVPVEDIMKYYATHMPDAFITTSESEGNPVSVQEALCYGLPIIGTSVGEIPYLIQGNGCLLPQNPTAEEITASILDMYRTSADKDRQDEMRSQSVRLWEGLYDGNTNAQLFTDILLDLSGE